MVGETASRTVTLTNLGGLGTRFRFLLASECCETDTSPSALNTVSVLLLLADAVTAQPRAARGVSCPETQCHQCTGGHVDVGGRRPSSGTASGQSRWKRSVSVRSAPRAAGCCPVTRVGKVVAKCSRP